MRDITCHKCGSEYYLTVHRFSGKSSGSVRCLVCRTGLVAWSNSTTAYSAKLKVRRTDHLKPNAGS
ncbi:hypothetical protein [Effusibacillus pohliae]|uniref:hypothetical protein n=1 Tax=Effusibacillus pohliae TaxID=232270 RepID=UPI0003684A76|nr:hypothetical protein [Effusibacillus pohliae]